MHSWDRDEKREEAFRMLVVVTPLLMGWYIHGPEERRMRTKSVAFGSAVVGVWLALIGDPDLASPFLAFGLVLFLTCLLNDLVIDLKRWLDSKDQ